MLSFCLSSHGNKSLGKAYNGSSNRNSKEKNKQWFCGEEVKRTSHPTKQAIYDGTSIKNELRKFCVYRRYRSSYPPILLEKPLIASMIKRKINNGAMYAINSYSGGKVPNKNWISVSILHPLRYASYDIHNDQDKSDSSHHDQIIIIT